MVVLGFFFFFKQKTAYEMRISDWSSDVCSSDLDLTPLARSLIAECARWGDEDAPLDDYALAMFRALAEATWALAERPSPASMPTGRTAEVSRAIESTAEPLANDTSFEEIARRRSQVRRRGKGCVVTI